MFSQYLFVFLSSVFHSPGSSPFSAAVEHRIDQVVSAFENSSTTPRYSYIEALNDGRGYTAGKVGFTTANGDLRDVVERYLRRQHHPELQTLMPILNLRAQHESGDIHGLENLPRIWRQCSNDAVFREAQDEVAFEYYRSPAIRYMQTYHLSSALTYLIFYDTLVQHGDGTDHDSFQGIIRRMQTHPANERAFLAEFLRVREWTLLYPVTASTAHEWQESVDRIYALRRLIRENRWDLQAPFTLTVFGDSYRIE